MTGEVVSVWLRLCGDFEIEARGVDLPANVMPGRQGRLVLAYLICARPRTVSRDELADLLWPDQVPDSWAASLSAVISKLRRLLGTVGLDASTVLVTSAAGVQLDLPKDVWVDYEFAHHAVETAEAALREGDHARVLAVAFDARDITSRGFLADPCEWVDRQRVVVEDLCVRAAVAEGEAHLLAGATARAVECGREAVARAPGREAGHRLLMRALAVGGERAEALRAWERCRAEVIEELGVEPSPQTEAVYLEILGADAPPVPVTAATATSLPSGVVTFLLTDIVESSALWERDSAAMDRALERHDALITDVVAGHGGTLLKAKLEGDATISVFPRATAAALAALDVRDALASEAWPTASPPIVRVAIHTGEAFERGGDFFGPALNRAARLRSLASGGQILVSQATAELIVDHLPVDVGLVDRGHRDLRGLSRGENVFELAPRDAVETDSPPAIQTGALLVGSPTLPSTLLADAPFVGRDEELGRLASAFDRAVAGEPRSVLVAGEPGVGKSRLIAEAAIDAHARGAVVLAGRCDEELGAPLQPFVECLRQLVPFLAPTRAAGVQGIDDLARLVPELGASTSAPAPRADPDSERYVLFDAFARLLSAVADEAPVVLVVDDLQWAGKTTLLLLRHLLRHAGAVRLLVLGSYRDTELGRTHPLGATLADLRRDGTAERITLGGLAPADVDAYLRLLGRTDRALSTELSRVTAGNPFFLIETLRHVEDSGGRWDPDDLPEGVRDATGRRLSNLSVEANEMLHIAAVTGAAFSLEIVEELSGRELVDEIGEACAAGLVLEEDGSTGRFRFAHALVRQVLLDELVTLKRLRLHRAIADLLEARPASDDDTRLAELAHHWFECAGAGDAARAVAACRRAADRAAERLAFTEAAELYGMAAEASTRERGPISSDDDERAELLVARADALVAAGDAAPTRVALAELEVAARGSPRWTAWHAILSAQLAVVAEPDRLGAMVPTLRTAASALHDQDDVRGEARAHYVHALALERLGRIGAAEQTLDRALGAARACGDRRLVDAVLASAPEAALWGPSPVTRASGRCLDVVRVLRITGGAPAVEAVALRCQAVLEALRGRLDAARQMVASARRTFDELGLAPRLLETDVTAALIELTYAHAAEAERLLRPALEALRDRGLDAETARAAALLGRALLAQGNSEEAAGLGEEASRLAGADLRAGVAWRAVLALAAAANGDGERALALGHEAVALAAGTDALLLEVDARMALAEVFRHLGDERGAEQETERAAALCERKGATTLVAHAAARAGSGRHVRADAAHRLVHDNLSTEHARQAQAAVNAGDFERFHALYEGTAYRHFGIGDLTGEELRKYLTPPATRPIAGTLTPLAAIGTRLSVSESCFDVPADDGATHWGDAQYRLLQVTDVDEHLNAIRAEVLPREQLCGAIVTLFQWHAQIADDASERDRAAGIARSVAAWRDRHAELVVDDVIECDLDHLVLVAGNDGGIRIELHFAPDGSLLDADQPRRQVRDNLATEVIHRVEDLINAGDHHGWRAFYEGCTFHRHDVGELTADETIQYVWMGPVPVTGTLTPLATLGRLIAVHRGDWDLGAGADETWGDATIDMFTVDEVDEGGQLVRSSLFPVTHLGPAIETLFERYAETSVSDDDRPRAVAAARAFADWRTANADLVLDDVLECDLDHLVVVARGEAESTAISIDFAPARRPGWERFEQVGRPWDADAFFNARDVDGYLALQRPDVQVHDHRAGRHTTYGLDQHVDQLRYLFGAASLHSTSRLLATRGDRLALTEHWYRGEWGDAGPTEFGLLAVVEYDADRLTARTAMYDAEDLAAAVAQLNAWYAESRDPSWPAWDHSRTYIARDVDDWDALLHPDVEFVDHRPLGLGTLHGRDAWADAMLPMRDALASVEFQDQHVLECRRVIIQVSAMSGAVEAADSGVPARFENRIVSVEERDDDGRIVRWDVYDDGQIEEAFTRYDAVAANDEPFNARDVGLDPFHNRVDEAMDQWVRAMNAHDRAAAEPMWVESFTWADRRSLSPMGTGDAAAALAANFDVAASSDWHFERLATRGQRLGLYRMTNRFRVAESGPASIALLAVVSVDENDRFCATIVFDGDATDAAYDELDARYAIDEGAPHAETWEGALAGLRALNDGDLGTVPRNDDWEVHDHRPTSFGQLDSTSWTAAAGSMDGLAEQQHVRVDHVLGLAEQATFFVLTRTGTDVRGGEFEGTIVVVNSIDDGGRSRRTDLYAVDQIDDAVARFEALSTDAED